ncbi:hypothetical protein [Alkalihalobacillus sp. 1P02AB]|uniref:hypothetical protein n=1 Tax=Alkalihalobacillus sp. 1P02AB TaxID=3132260 RepID=UPI0039A4873D
MEELGEQIKKSLNRTVYKQNRFSKKHKENIRKRVLVKKRANKFYPSLLISAAIIILLLLAAQVSEIFIHNEFSSAYKENDSGPTLNEINLKGEVDNLQKEIELLEDLNHRMFGYVHRFEDPYVEMEVLHKEKIGEDYFLLFQMEDRLEFYYKPNPHGTAGELSSSYEEDYVERPIQGFSWSGVKGPNENMYYGMLLNKNIATVRIKMDSVEQETFIFERENGERIWVSFFEDDPSVTGEHSIISIEVVDLEGSIIWNDSFQSGYVN